MTSALHDQPDPRRWIVVAVMFLALGLSFAGRTSLPVMFGTWEAEFGWSRTFLSTGASVILVVMGLSAPFVGNFVDRFGPRFILGGGLCLSGLAIGLTAIYTTPWSFVILFCGMAAVGYGVVSIPIAAATIARKFDKNRGFATSIGLAGLGGGQLVFLPLIAWAIVAIGWRETLMAFGLWLIVMGILSVVFMDNEVRVATTEADKENTAEDIRGKLHYIFTHKIFWLLASAYIICGFTTAGVIKVHFIPYARACGFTLNESTAAFGFLAAFDAVGMLIAGWLTDRMHRPLLLGLVYFLRALTFLLLFFITDNIAVLFIFAMLFGSLDFATVPPTSGLVASHLGLRTMGLSMGIMFAGHSLGGALGAFLGGVAFDLLAQYQWVWIAALALAFVASILAWSVPERRDKVPESEAVPAAA